MVEQSSSELSEEMGKSVKRQEPLSRMLRNELTGPVPLKAGSDQHEFGGVEGLFLSCILHVRPFDRVLGVSM